MRKDAKTPTTRYVQELRDRLSWAYQQAIEAAKKAQANQQDNYNTKVRGAAVQKGDRVLVKIVAYDGKHKIADRWEDVPYVVIQQRNPEIPVYTVIREDGEGRTRELHRNLFLPIGYIRDNQPLPKPKPAPRKRTRLQKTKQKTTSEESDDDSSSEEESTDNFDVVVLDEPAISEPSVTDITADQDTEPAPEDSFLSGDAQPEDDRGPEMELAEGSASDTTEIVKTEEDQEKTDEQPQDVRSPPVPRRSTRERRQPAWMSSGKYSFQALGTHTQTNSSDEWLRKAEYLQSLLSNPLFSDFRRETALAILETVSHH